MKNLSELLAEVEPDYGCRVGLTECFMKLKTDYDKLKAIAVELARALEYNKSKHNEWIDKGHWCDSKKVLQSVVDSSGQALTTARKMLGDE